MKRISSKSAEIEDRAIREAEYIIEYNATVREVANKFLISKSTVHRDLSKVLPLINKKLYNKIKVIFYNHNEVRHHNGGVAASIKKRTKTLGGK